MTVLTTDYDKRKPIAKAEVEVGYQRTRRGRPKTRIGDAMLKILSKDK